MQQSAAFKVLRTRLKTVPPYSFGGEKIKRSSSGNPYSQKYYITSEDRVSEDGDMDEDAHNLHSGVNFSSRLQQFKQMQDQHRMHLKSQAQARYSSMLSSKVR